MNAAIRRLFDDRLRRRADALARRLAPHLPASPRLLDVGSGTGHNARALERLAGGSCREVDVVDFHVVGPGPALFDGVRLPFHRDEFDMCLVLHVLTYADDPSTLLREAGRVASRGVVLVQSTHRGAWGRAALGLRGALQGTLAFRACRAFGLIPPAADPLRPRRRFTRGRLLRVVAESGLVVRSIEAEPGLGGAASRDLLILEHPPGRDRDRGSRA
ncbi:methyltransferase domain-containing protein [Paludisphaera soli]|uniref:methyltransferase domain-containing protein n=1 Tax=Paludisphaera soli TaxID=2712865 RepID=UPI0013ED2A7A|nr:methyltransferase domain-containing protein [Paludisphaera soli]